MKRWIAILTAAALVVPAAAPAEEDDLMIEEIVENVLLDDTGEEIPLPAAAPAAQAAVTVFTPSYASAWPIREGETGYWTLPMDITDETAVWEMLMAPITVVDTGKDSGEKTQTYLYREPDESSLKVGVVTCESQGVRVLETREDGWSLVECYSSSFHATKVEAWNLLVSGYIPTKYLKQVSPNPDLGIVVDKLTQRMYIFQDGKLLSTLLCSTGLVMWNGSKYQPYNETRSGEFLLMSKVGTLISDRLYCDMAIRFNSGDMMHEVPHVKNADGTKNYGSTEYKLGTKCSHGCIRVQRNKTPEGINMSWIWNQVKSGSKVKFVIWEDWQGRQIAVPDADTPLYYNPNKGNYYHRSSFCYSAKAITFQPFTYGELDQEPFSKLKQCPFCGPPLREAEIQAVNERYAEGGDHDELLTSLQAGYYEYLQQN
ncbi:MAG: L,D-transpeptidase family protein [Clostridia bacterium]|nr:L,D-transpeptidase family protein [Clostridia bacterium]